MDFPPAYPPDLNPIEKMWSKVKASLRGAEARTQDALLEALAEALERVNPRMPSIGSPRAAIAFFNLL